MDFLADLEERGAGFSTVNTAKAALSSVIILPSGGELSKHPIIIRFMRGIFQRRPSLPRYTHTWDVNHMLQYLNRQDLGQFTLKQLTLKLTMLLCLLTGQRLQTLAALDTRHMHITDQQCTSLDQGVNGYLVGQ